jgi:polyisoprenoid-binding protein YceI
MNRNWILAPALLLVLAACAPKVAAPAEKPDRETAPPAAASPAATDAPAGRYRLDRSHASLLFRVNHIGFSDYVGRFRRFDATLDFDPAAPETMRLSATVDLTSLEIPEPPAGFLEELLGPQWLNAGAFPSAEFTSTALELLAPDAARVSGALTLNGRTAPLEMTVTFNGGYAGLEVYDPQGRIGFSARGTLSRSAFGIALGLPPEGSTLGVGDAVAFEIEAEFTGPPMR